MQQHTSCDTAARFTKSHIRFLLFEPAVLTRPGMVLVCLKICHGKEGLGRLARYLNRDISQER